MCTASYYCDGFQNIVFESYLAKIRKPNLAFAKSVHNRHSEIIDGLPKYWFKCRIFSIL